MALIRQLLGDWVGLLSLITIVAAIGIIVYLMVYFLRRSKE
ncbi:MAG: DUF3149 domain-containing protein [Pseudomonadota bacterium]